MCEIKGISATDVKFDHVIVDFRNFIYRTLHVIDTSNIVNALFDVLNRLASIADRYDVRYENFHVCLEGGKNWRYKIFPEYKGNRDYSSDLDSQVKKLVPALENIIKYCKFSVWDGEECEGDDIFGTLSRRLSDANSSDVIGIYSSDRDLLQLSTDNIYNIIPIQKEGDVIINEYLHFARYGYAPHDRILIKALEGDQGDNIPGVYGIGKSFAEKIAKDYKSIDELKKAVLSIEDKRKGEKVSEYKERLKKTNPNFTEKKFNALKSGLDSLYLSYIIGSIVLNSKIFKLENLEFDDTKHFSDFISEITCSPFNKAIIYIANTELFNWRDNAKTK